MKTILSLLLYIILYMYMYVNYLVYYFGYLGYKNNFDVTETPFSFFVTFIYLLIPMFFLKKIGVLRYFFIISYLLLYIPVIVTFLFHYSNNSIILYYNTVICLSYCIIFFVPKFFSMSKFEIKEFDLKYILLLNIFLSFLILLFNLKYFKFVSFEDVYEHRSEFKISSPLFAYLILWNTYILSPLTLIKGLINSNKTAIYIGILSSVLIYGINASKIVLFIPILICFFYYKTVKNNKNIFIQINLFFSFILAFFTFFSSSFFVMSAVILMRTFGITGLLMYQYNEFFLVNDLTYFSHINIVNYITNLYPYGDKPLGLVVNQFFNEDSLGNSNANFWATDGISSLGFLGVIIISILLGFFLGIWKSLTTRSNFTMMLLLLVPFSFIVLNVGLFTSILSGGYLIFVLLLLKRKLRI